MFAGPPALQGEPWNTPHNAKPATEVLAGYWNLKLRLIDLTFTNTQFGAIESAYIHVKRCCTSKRRRLSFLMLTLARACTPGDEIMNMRCK